MREIKPMNLDILASRYVTLVECVAKRDSLKEELDHYDDVELKYETAKKISDLQAKIKRYLHPSKDEVKVIYECIEKVIREQS